MSQGRPPTTKEHQLEARARAMVKLEEAVEASGVGALDWIGFFLHTAAAENA